MPAVVFHHLIWVVCEAVLDVQNEEKGQCQVHLALTKKQRLAQEVPQQTSLHKILIMMWLPLYAREAGKVSSTFD